MLTMNFQKGNLFCQETYGFTLNQINFHGDKVFKYFGIYTTPEKTGAQTMLSRVVINWIGSTKNSILVVYGEDEAPFEEETEIFNAYRRDIGINEEISDSLFHLMAEGDDLHLKSLLLLCLHFDWEPSLISSDGARVASFGDGVFGLYSNDYDSLLDVMSVVGKSCELFKWRHLSGKVEKKD